METAGRTTARAFALAVLALSLTAACALATEPTRAEYVASVEPICKADVKANANIFRGVKGQLESGALKKAAKRFSQAAREARRSHQELELVQQPLADERRLTKWLDALDVEVHLLGKIGSALRAEEKGPALRHIKHLHHNAIHANNLVLGFGLAYCTLDVSKFNW